MDALDFLQQLEAEFRAEELLRSQAPLTWWFACRLREYYWSFRRLCRHTIWVLRNLPTLNMSVAVPR